MPGAPEIQAIEDVMAAADGLGLEVMLIGAGARILLIDEPYGNSERQTHDRDFCVRVAGWGEYERLGQALLASGRFTRTKVPHRFTHGAGTMVDLVPFGGIEDGQGRIRFEGSGKVMNLRGTREALAAAKLLEIGQVRVRVVSEAGLVLLKLFAWDDRRELKDLQDIAAVLDHYDRNAAADDIFDRLAEELANDVITYDEAPACLLGLDLGLMAEPETRAELAAVLEELLAPEETVLNRLIRHHGEDEDDVQQTKIVGRFRAMLYGLRKAERPAA